MGNRRTAMADIVRVVTIFVVIFWASIFLQGCSQFLSAPRLPDYTEHVTDGTGGVSIHTTNYGRLDVLVCDENGLPMPNVTVATYELENGVLVVASGEDTAPGFRFLPRETLSSYYRQSTPSNVQPQFPVITVAIQLVRVVSVAWTIYEWITNPDEAPIQIPGLLEGSRKVKTACFQIDANDLIDIGQMILDLTTFGGAIKVIGAPAARRGVTAIALGFTKRKLKEELITTAARETVRSAGILDTDLINTCEYVFVDSRKEEHRIPLLLWDVREASGGKPNKPPSARFRANPTAGSPPLFVRFDASESFDPDGRIVSYRWAFGDGDTAVTQQPYVEHTYTREGTFVVSLTVEDDAGALSSAQVSITVTGKPCVNRPGLWTDKNEYCVGEEVEIFITVSDPSYVDVWVAYPDGTVKSLVSNRYLDAPGERYVLRARAGEPVGSRTLYLKARACGKEVTVSWSVNVKRCAPPPAGLPDLIIERVDVTTLNTSRCPEHLGVEVRVTVANIGKAAVGSFDAAVCLVSCPAFCCIPCEVRRIGSLAVGERKTLSVGLSIPAMCFLWGADPPLNPPPAVILVKADANNEVVEENENNNIREINIPYICP